MKAMTPHIVFGLIEVMPWWTRSWNDNCQRFRCQRKNGRRL